MAFQSVSLSLRTALGWQCCSCWCFLLFLPAVAATLQRLHMKMQPGAVEMTKKEIKETSKFSLQYIHNKSLHLLVNNHQI